MNILILEFTASPNAGGAEKSMSVFAEHLSHDHGLYLGYHIEGNIIQDYKYSAIYTKTIKLMLPHMSLGQVLNWLKDYLSLYHFVKKNKIDLIITHLVHISPLLRLLKMVTGVPYSIYYKWVCSFAHVGMKVKWGNRSALFAAAVSSYVANYWVENGIPVDRIKVVPEGVSSQKIRDYTNVSSHHIYVGFAGRIVPEKGLEDLISAISILHEKNIDVCLRIAGTFNGSQSINPNEYHLKIEKQIEQLHIKDLIYCDGFVSPLEPWFSKIDLLVVPSTCNDAQPLVMMQAMSTGTPVIGTAVGGIPEILYGELEELLVFPNNPIILATRIESLCRDITKREHLGKKVFNLASKKYNIEEHFKQLKQALNIRTQ